MSGRRQKRKRKARNKREHGKRAQAVAVAPKVDPAELDEQERLRRLERLAELYPELGKAVAEHAELFARDSTEYAHLRATHLAAERVWVLRSSICYELGQHDAARKAASTANEHARQAARLERDSLADRVAALETEMTRARTLGRELDEL